MKIELQNDTHLFVKGERLLPMLGATPKEIIQLQKCWNDLVLDRYMADGGLYRYRRYGQFNINRAENTFKKLPHKPYSQPISINYLNGGVTRYFEPLSAEFVGLPLLKALLNFLCEICDRAIGKTTDWDVKLHPYRIVANKEVDGNPTPEGLHRDGVTFIASLLINKVNAVGGVTTVTDHVGSEIFQVCLDNPFDLVLCDDEKTMHKVSSIRSNSVDKMAFRDVLVVAFTTNGGETC
ncbi:MAG: 2OG-Fe dioxygenase family protein [Vibrio sp.]